MRHDKEVGVLSDEFSDARTSAETAVQNWTTVAAPEIVTLPAEDELHYEARTPFMKKCKCRWRTDDDFK
jgi:hypothetical protein